jgi:hypothetical protein
MSQKIFFKVLEEIDNNVVLYWSVVLISCNHSSTRLVSFTVQKRFKSEIDSFCIRTQVKCCKEGRHKQIWPAFLETGKHRLIKRWLTRISRHIHETFLFFIFSRHSRQTFFQRWIKRASSLIQLVSSIYAEKRRSRNRDKPSLLVPSLLVVAYHKKTRCNGAERKRKGMWKRGID